VIDKTVRVGELFGHLWPAYVGESVKVDLLPRVEGAPFHAACVWKAGRWHIIADASEPHQKLFQRLMHETAHARFGHVPKKGCADPDLLRRVFTGQEQSAQNSKAVRRSVTNAKATEARRAQERQAHEWAEEESAKLWPLVEAYLGASETEAGALLVELDEAVKAYNQEVK
jgi:hypothetical protein